MRAHILGGLVAAGIMMAAGTAVAHHSFAAEFDANKPIKLTGKVTKVEWTNPHVWFYINVKDEKSGEVTNWAQKWDLLTCSSGVGGGAIRSRSVRK